MTPEESSLSGKVAMITGASSGIGKATSLLLAQKGAKIALIARRLDALVNLKDEISSAGGEALPVAVDLRDHSQIEGAFEALRRKWGGVDILVNSAGLGHDAPLMTGDSKKLEEMLNLNVLALTIATREALTDMEKRGAGHIVHISSMSAYRVQTGTGMYAATKHAVRALTEGLRRELRAKGSSVRVTSVSPGDVDTEFMERMLGREGAKNAAVSYRQLEATDIAREVLHVLTAPPHVEIHDILIRPTGQPD